MAARPQRRFAIGNTSLHLPFFASEWNLAGMKVSWVVERQGCARFLLLALGLAFAGQTAAQTPLEAEDDVGASKAADDDDAQAVFDRESRRVLRIAVYDLSVTGVDDKVASVVNEFLLEELRKLQRTSVIGYSEIRTLIDLEADRQALGCDSEESCLAEVADALGSDFLITGTLARVGTEHVFGLKVIDQKEAKAGRTFNKVVSAGDGTEFLAEIGPAVETLFPEVPLKEGASRGVAPEAARFLAPPPLPPLVFWSGVAVTSVAFAGALVAAVTQFGAYSSYLNLTRQSQTELVDGKDLVAAGQIAFGAEVVGWSLLGAGLIGAGVSALLVPLTDFDGARNAMAKGDAE